MVLEKTLESPLDCKEIKAVNPERNQFSIFIGRLMLKLKLQYLGHLMRRADALEKTLMLGKIEGRRGSAGKEFACNAGALGSIPELGRSPEGNGYPLQYSALENSMDCRVHGVTKSRKQLSNFHFHQEAIKILPI